MTYIIYKLTNGSINYEKKYNYIANNIDANFNKYYRMHYR